MTTKKTNKPVKTKKTTLTEREQAQKMGEAMMRFHKKESARRIARRTAELNELEAVRKKGLVPELRWHRSPNVFQFKTSTGHWFWVKDGDYGIQIQLHDKPFDVNYRKKPGYEDIGCSESIKYENAGEVETDISCLDEGESCSIGDDEGIKVSKKKGSYFVEGIKVSDNDIRVLCLVLGHLSCWECSPSEDDETWLLKSTLV